MFGEVPGVAIGDTFTNRRAAYDVGVHRQLQAGIVGRAADGAESIVLAGGYVDDEDYGDVIVYTGHGGNDPGSHRQVADQDLTHQNLALARNEDEGIPVRVVRKDSVSGLFRYDGLYRVVRHWHEVGRDGFRIQRFRLERMLVEPDRSPPALSGSLPSGNETPARRTGETQRVVRLTEVGRRVKALHDSTCQACGTRLETATGPYAEAAHIRPLGRPHDGPDTPDNVLCLCANCHVLFDKGAFAVGDDLALIGARSGALRVHEKHNVSLVILTYQREHIFVSQG